MKRQQEGCVRTVGGLLTLHSHTLLCFPFCTGRWGAAGYIARTPLGPAMRGNHVRL